MFTEVKIEIQLVFVLFPLTLNSTLPVELFAPTKKPPRIRKKKPKKTDSFGLQVNAPWHYILLPNADHKYQYPHRFIECFSSSDAAYNKEVLSAICIPELGFGHRYDGAQNPYGPNKMDFTGADKLAEFFAVHALAAPDLIITLYDKVTGHWDEKTGESFITFKYIMSLTRTKLLSRVDGVKHQDDDVVSSVPPDIIHNTHHSVSNCNFDNANSLHCTEDNQTVDIQPIKKLNDGGVDNLISDFKTFNLKPLKPIHVFEKSYCIAKVFLTINTEQKITHVGHVFRINSVNPLIKKEPKNSNSS